MGNPLDSIDQTGADFNSLHRHNLWSSMTIESKTPTWIEEHTFYKSTMCLKTTVHHQSWDIGGGKDFCNWSAGIEFGALALHLGSKATMRWMQGTSGCSSNGKEREKVQLLHLQYFSSFSPPLLPSPSSPVCNITHHVLQHFRCRMDDNFLTILNTNDGRDDDISGIPPRLHSDSIYYLPHTSWALSSSSSSFQSLPRDHFTCLPLDI